VICGFETGVLNPRPKFLGFHMSGPTTNPYMPKKETRWRQRKEVYYAAWDRS
jgi:hypothetical protein